MKVSSINFEVSKMAEKDYMKLPFKVKVGIVHKIIASALDGRITNIVPLKKYPNIKRIKCGNYRIIFRILDSLSYEIYMIGDRKKIYPRIDRKEVRYG